MMPQLMLTHHKLSCGIAKGEGRSRYRKHVSNALAFLNLQLFFLANGGLSQTNVKANATVTEKYIIKT